MVQKISETKSNFLINNQINQIIDLINLETKQKEIDILIDEVYSLLKSNRWESFLKIAENDDLWNATIFLQKMLSLFP